MAYDDIEIRITKTGKIFVRLARGSEQQIADYRRFLEEVIGPIQGEVIITRPDWDHPAELSEEAEAERRRLEQQLER